MAGFRRARRPLLSGQEDNAEKAEIAGREMPPARHASQAPAPRPPSGPSCVTARGPGPSAATSALGWAGLAGHGRPRHSEPRLGKPRGRGRTTALSSTAGPGPGPDPNPGPDPSPGRRPGPARRRRRCRARGIVGARLNPLRSGAGEECPKHPILSNSSCSREKFKGFVSTRQS